MIGIQLKERLFQLLHDGDYVSLVQLKQMVYDFIKWRPDVRKAINPKASKEVLCRECCQYVSTVAIAILFDLTGLMSLYATSRDFQRSNLVVLRFLLYL